MTKPANMVTTDTLTAADLAAAALAEGAAPPEIAEPAAPGEEQAAAPPPVSDPDLKNAKPGARVRKGGKPASEDATSANVLVRITKAGHEQVHDGAGGTFEWNDEVVLPRTVGRDLEEVKFGEIVGSV